MTVFINFIPFLHVCHSTLYFFDVKDERLEVITAIVVLAIVTLTPYRRDVIELTELFS